VPSGCESSSLSERTKFAPVVELVDTTDLRSVALYGRGGSSPFRSTKTKTMEQIGDKRIIGNPEDISSLRILEINDVYEVSPSETYFEIIEKPLWVGTKVAKRGGL
jgi:hypothetical protein